MIPYQLLVRLLNGLHMCANKIGMVNESMQRLTYCMHVFPYLGSAALCVLQTAWLVYATHTTNILSTWDSS